MTTITDGFYLEVKKSKVGTGHTASEVTFRNLYLVRQMDGEKVEAVLLDSKLAPTGLREKLHCSEPGRRGWRHVPQLQDRFEKVCSRVGPLPPAAKPEAGPPQARPASPPPAARPQASPPASKPRSGPPAEQKDQEPERAWWELTSKGSGGLGKG